VNFIAYRQRLIDQHEREDVATSKMLIAYQQTIHLFDRIAALAKGFAPFSHPCLLIAAVGNGSNNLGTGTFALGAEAPAMCEDFIGVGAIDPPDVKGGLTVSDFSNSGPAVCAPGAGIIGAGVPSGLNTLSLTSTAAPHAAGVAALWAHKLLQQNRLTARELTARFLGSADISGFDSKVSPPDAIGLGLVQAPLR
jgi:subtilisin family serine protease